MNTGKSSRPMDHAQTAELLVDAIEALTEGMAVYDADNRLVTCNQRYRDMFPMIADLIKPGVSWDDLLRAGAERGQYPTAVGRVEDWLRERLAHHSLFDQNLEVELSNGSVYEVQFSTTRQGGFVVTNTDITERREAETAAREQENILRTVLDTSPIAVVMARLKDGRIVYRSPGATAMFGDRQTALDHYESQKDRDNYISALSETGSVDEYRITLIKADGQRCAVTSWGRLIEFEGETHVVTAMMDLSERQAQEELIRRVLEACPTPIQMTKAETGEVLFTSPETQSLFGMIDKAKQFYANPKTREDYLKLLRLNGSVSEFKAEYINARGERFWGAVSARLIPYNGEEVIVSHTRDLTEQLRIEAELSQKQDQLYQNEKMSAMGELLAGVAHELNNPLSVVVGHALMLREDCTDPEILRQADKISGAAERCAKIVKTFLTMARQRPVKVQRMDINEVVQIAVDVARHSGAEPAQTIDCQLAPGLEPICADPDQITQVFINLILNAEHAMRESGKGTKILVTTQPATAASGIEILVEDDGPGIPDDIRGRVFEPFFTTRDIGDGTGIGLALCHRIVQTHNGWITVSTGPDGGAAFKIFLPFEVEQEAEPHTLASKSGECSSARILIVDDEEDVADLNAEILARSGYEVDVFDQCDTALENLRHHDYALIISDLNMPGIDGRGFFEIISKEFPHMIERTGFVTGDTMGRSSQTFLAEAGCPYIEKPVSPKELRAFVADILSKQEQAGS
ncbi:MAG: PAS-domain containing protein [Pseudomonadota bacterium]